MSPGRTPEVLSPVDGMLARLSLAPRADLRMLALSGGEVRRVEPAATLKGSPGPVILDEPTTGLDPASRRDVGRLVFDLRDDGATGLLATHYLDEGEALADRLEIMHAGRILWGQAAGPLLVIAAWTFVAVALARRSIRWEPRS